MRRSSRRLPPVPPPKHRWQRAGAWCFVSILLCGLVVLLLEYPVGTVGVVSLFVVVCWWELRRKRRILQSVAAARGGESICEFARSFDLRVVDPLVVRVVYGQLQDELSGLRPGFPVRASDQLAKDLSVDNDELDPRILMEIARRAGRSLDSTRSNPYFGRIETASDLVHFLNQQPESARRKK